MIVIAWFFVVCYTVFVLAGAYFWLKLPVIKSDSTYIPKTKISVLIAVRNEAANIQMLLTDLAAQNYPAALLEILIIDDSSEDETVSLIENFKQNSELDLRVFSLKNSTVSGKKGAINFGIQQASGQLLVLTDGDCRVQPNWLALFEQAYAISNVKFISGPVCLAPAQSFFEKLQVVEFASLIGIGAASIGMQKPTMCNGANVAYEKAAFLAVNGFAGNEAIASGDDEFLLHKINKAYPGQLSFLKNQEAIVYTPPVKVVKNFFQQRIRWAGKWRHYQNFISQLVAVLVFGANLTILIAAFGAILNQFPAAAFWQLYLLKSGIDFLFLFLVLTFFKQTRFLLFFIPLQLVYVPYVIYCALAGLNGSYIWKQRKIILK